MRTIADFFWFMVAVFAAIIAGFFLLGFLARTFGNNIVGKAASTLEGAASAQ